MEDTPRPNTTGILLVILAIITALAVVFGVTTVRSRAAFTRYKAATVDNPEQPLPWTTQAMSPAACVSFSVDWALACPSIQSWCFNESPQLVLACMATQDRREYCQAHRDAIGTTRFGVAQCESLRSDLEGKYIKRNHKKACGSAYRAVAAHCADLPESLESRPAE